MLIIELTYKKSLDKVKALLDQHRAFLDKYYEKQIFIASGPKQPRDGGVILSNADRELLQTILTEDPFYQHEIADYRIIAFEPTKYSDDFKKLLPIEEQS